MSRIDEVARLRMRGLNHQQIADELHLNTHTVRTHLNRIRQKWKSERMVQLDEAIVLEVARLNHLEAEYWRAWNDSKSPENLTPLRSRLLLDGRHPNGDPRYLDGVMKCISRRIQLLGLDQAKVDVSAMIRRYAEAVGMDPDEALSEAHRVVAELRQQDDSWPTDSPEDDEEPQSRPINGSAHPQWATYWTEEEHRELARLITEHGSVTAGAQAYSELHPGRTVHAAVSQYYLNDRFSTFTTEANGEVNGQA
jgi:Bacterial regulatory proteins, luxR family